MVDKSVASESYQNITLDGETLLEILTENSSLVATQMSGKEDICIGPNKDWKFSYNSGSSALKLINSDGDTVLKFDQDGNIVDIDNIEGTSLNVDDLTADSVSSNGGLSGTSLDLGTSLSIGSWTIQYDTSNNGSLEVIDPDGEEVFDLRDVLEKVKISNRDVEIRQKLEVIEKIVTPHIDVDELIEFGTYVGDKWEFKMGPNEYIYLNSPFESALVVIDDFGDYIEFNTALRHPEYDDASDAPEDPRAIVRFTENTKYTAGLYSYDASSGSWSRID